MKEQNTTATDEVELGSLVNVIVGFFRNLLKLLFLGITFIKKNIVLTIIIIVAGAILGYILDNFFDKEEPVYENHVIVIPNFESVDFLYETVEGLNAKIASNDSIYLRSVLGDKFRYLVGVKIEPIVDIYNFATKSPQYTEIFKILAQNKDLSEFVEEMTSGKNFKYHRMNFFIEGNLVSETIVENFLTQINENPHFKKHQELSEFNTNWMIKQNDIMITQVDSIIEASLKYANSKDGNQSVLINDNSSLGGLVNGKQQVLYRRSGLLLAGNEESAVIKNVGSNYNILKRGLFSGGYKLKLPVIFMLLFYGIFFIRFSYNRLKSIAEND